MLTPEEFHERITRPLIEYLSARHGVTPSICVPSSELDEREFNHALWWVRRKRNPQGYKMAVLRPDLPESIMQDITRGSVLRPKRIIFIESEYHRLCTVHVPYSTEEIGRQLKNGSLIDCHAIVEVPRNYLSLVG